MSTQIASTSRQSYDLLDELVAYYGLSAMTTHARIIGIVNARITARGRDKVIISDRPVNPYNAQGDTTVARWLEISDETAQEVREHFAATVKPRRTR